MSALTPERVFARRMKRERLGRGWRQEDLADHLAGMGLELHPSAIAKMEREPDPERGIEPRMIRLNEARIIASALDLQVDQMLLGDDDDPNAGASVPRRALKSPIAGGLVVRPGDTLLVWTERLLTADVAADYREQIRKRLPGLADVVVLNAAGVAAYRSDGEAADL